MPIWRREVRAGMPAEAAKMVPDEDRVPMQLPAELPYAPSVPIEKIRAAVERLVAEKLRSQPTLKACGSS